MSSTVNLLAEKIGRTLCKSKVSGFVVIDEKKKIYAVWMELHQDPITLAAHDKTRRDAAAALGTPSLGEKYIE